MELARIKQSRKPPAIQPFSRFLDLPKSDLAGSKGSGIQKRISIIA
jgi:hypothetical protein